jgi:hypothetical protein
MILPGAPVAARQRYRPGGQEITLVCHRCVTHRGCTEAPIVSLQTQTILPRSLASSSLPIELPAR